jgi:GLPGLI family protein
MSHRLLLTFLCLCLPGLLLAQRTVSDAKIVYKMELPPEQLQMDAMLEGSTFTQYMRGPLSRIDMNFNIVHYTYLINSKDETMTTLIDQHGTKYLIRAGKEEYEKDLKQYENIQFNDQSETKQIAGYNCRKTIGTMPGGQTFEVYYATDLMPENRQYNRRFVNLKGLPLEFEIVTKTGAKTRVIATKVELYPIPASYFDVPKTGYKEVSQQELKNM